MTSILHRFRKREREYEKNKIPGSRHQSTPEYANSWAKSRDLEVLNKKFPKHQVGNIQIMLKEYIEQHVPPQNIVGAKASDDWFDEFPTVANLLQEAKINKDGKFVGVLFTQPRYQKVFPNEIEPRLGLMIKEVMNCALLKSTRDKHTS